MLHTPRSCWVIVASAVLALAACARQSENKIPRVSKAILEQADQFQLLSLDPVYQVKAVKDDFYGYKVLGTTLVKDAETRKKLVSAFERGVAENQGIMAACFNPRHGIHVTRGGKTADFVICFECDQVSVHGDVQGHFLITGSPQPVFDRALLNANVPLGRR